MQITRSITSAIRAVSAAALLLALSACGGNNAAPAAEPPTKLAKVLLPGLEATKTSAQSLTPKATLPSFTGHGWWWNPAEPGTGFAFEVQGTQAFVAFFMYDQLIGAPVWYASFGTFNGTTFTGNLQSFKNGMPVATTAFKPAVLDATQGLITIVFSSATAGQVTFPGGRVQNVERYNFVAPLAGEPAPVRLNKPEAGWWWNQDEPGRGYAIERQGNDIFLAMFHYTAAGGNTWNIINAKLDANTNAYGSTLKSVAGGQSLTGSWRAASFGADAGKVDIIFNTPCEATMRLPAGNVINLRKYNFGGDDARCRADIVAAAAPALPLLAQCYTVNPGVIITKRTTPSIRRVTAANGTNLDYYIYQDNVRADSTTFQGRAVQRLITTTTNLQLPLTANNPFPPSTSIRELTPTSFQFLSPESTIVNGASIVVNAGRAGARDMTIGIGGKQFWTSTGATFAPNNVQLSSLRSYEFAGLETLNVAGKVLRDVCKINYTITSGVNFDGSLNSGTGFISTGSVWYAPGYGSVKESWTTIYQDRRTPSSVNYEIVPTLITP